MNNFEKAQFCIDSIEGVVFEGYANQVEWNGFTCPRFEKPVAERVLQSSAPNGYTWSYDPKQDAYHVRNSEDPLDYEPEEFAGQLIDVSGQLVKVYPIGAYSWTWNRCNERAEYNGAG